MVPNIGSCVDILMKIAYKKKKKKKKKKKNKEVVVLYNNTMVFTEK